MYSNSRGFSGSRKNCTRKRITRARNLRLVRREERAISSLSFCLSLSLSLIMDLIMSINHKKEGETGRISVLEDAWHFVNDFGHR